MLGALFFIFSAGGHFSCSRRFVDIDDTLLDFGKCAEQAMRIGFAEWGLPYDDSTYATFTRINDGLWLMIERGELTTQQLFQFRWNRIFDALGIRADGAAFEQRFLDLLYETAIPVDGAAEIWPLSQGQIHPLRGEQRLSRPTAQPAEDSGASPLL